MSNLLSLLQLSDPVLPIGGFAHSYGLETYVQKGIVNNVSSARDFIVQMLSQNIRFTDAAFVALAYDAVLQNDINQIQKLDQECTALKLPKEIRSASHKLGTRLLKIFAGIDNKLVVHLKAASEQRTFDANYSVMFGAFAAIFEIGKKEALTGFFYNAAAGMVTNSVKLVPLGQQDGQQILFSLRPLIQILVDCSLNPDPEMIGMSCPGFDINSMQHERLYSRLYMS